MMPSQKKSVAKSAFKRKRFLKKKRKEEREEREGGRGDKGRGRAQGGLPACLPACPHPAFLLSRLHVYKSTGSFPLCADSTRLAQDTEQADVITEEGKELQEGNPTMSGRGRRRPNTRA